VKRPAEKCPDQPLAAITLNPEKAKSKDGLMVKSFERCQARSCIDGGGPREGSAAFETRAPSALIYMDIIKTESVLSISRNPILKKCRYRCKVSAIGIWVSFTLVDEAIAHSVVKMLY
jgi:hypothetical protein